MKKQRATQSKDRVEPRAQLSSLQRWEAAAPRSTCGTKTSCTAPELVIWLHWAGARGAGWFYRRISARARSSGADDTRIGPVKGASRSRIRYSVPEMSAEASTKLATTIELRTAP